jgi:hypothetical protein
MADYFYAVRADAAFGTCDVFETHVLRRTSDAQNAELYGTFLL